MMGDIEMNGKCKLSDELRTKVSLNYLRRNRGLTMDITVVNRVGKRRTNISGMNILWRTLGVIAVLSIRIRSERNKECSK